MGQTAIAAVIFLVVSSFGAQAATVRDMGLMRSNVPWPAGRGDPPDGLAQFVNDAGTYWEIGANWLVQPKKPDMRRLHEVISEEGLPDQVAMRPARPVTDERPELEGPDGGRAFIAAAKVDDDTIFGHAASRMFHRDRTGGVLIAGWSIDPAGFLKVTGNRRSADADLQPDDAGTAFPMPVPLPAAAPFLLTGVGAMGFLRRRARV